MSEDEDEAQQADKSVKDAKPAPLSRAANKKQKKTKVSRKVKEEAAAHDDVDIDAALKDLGLDASSPTLPAPSQTNETEQAFTFSINSKLLNPDEGMWPWA